jgi:hypothetical protein
MFLHACFCSEAHDYEPLPGCKPGQAFIRRLAPELFSAKQLPPGLQQRLAETGLDWNNHPGNTRRVSGGVQMQWLFINRSTVINAFVYWAVQVCVCHESVPLCHS